MWVANAVEVSQVRFSPVFKLWTLKLSCGAPMRSPFIALDPEKVYASEDEPAELVCPEDCQLDCIVRVCSGKVEPSAVR